MRGCVSVWVYLCVLFAIKVKWKYFRIYRNCQIFCIFTFLYACKARRTHTRKYLLMCAYVVGWGLCEISACSHFRISYNCLPKCMQLCLCVCVRKLFFFLPLHVAKPSAAFVCVNMRGRCNRSSKQKPYFLYMLEFER